MSSNQALNTIVSTISTFTKATYEQWCFKCKIELGKELYDVVTGVLPPPSEDANETAISTYETKNRQAMRILIPSIVEPEYQLIGNCETARDIWLVLEANFRDISMLRQWTIHDHITAAFNKLYHRIKTFPKFKDLPDAIFVTRSLRSLPSEYATFARFYDTICCN